MEDSEWLAARFDKSRNHLRSVAYRLLGSLDEADDAIQEAWLRLSRSDTSSIENLTGWLTTVVARVSLDMLRARRSRTGLPFAARVPDPIVSGSPEADPEQEVSISALVIDDSQEFATPECEAITADSICIAMLVVLETLTPSERLAFVLHDIFEVPFEEIAAIIDKTPTAARKLASRARRRVLGASPPADASLGVQREVVAAFLAAARDANFDALVRLLDPNVIVRSDLGTTLTVARGADSVAQGAITGARLSTALRSVMVNGTPGVIAFNEEGVARAVIAYTVRTGKIAEINILADADRLRQLNLTQGNRGHPS